MRFGLFRLGLTSLLILTWNLTFSQSREWYEMIDDPNANFLEIQEAAEAYFDEFGTGKGTGWKAYKRWESHWESLVSEDGVFPTAQALLSGLQQHQFNMLSENYSSTSGDWVDLGPFDVPINGTGQPTGLGRVNTVAFDPTNSSIMYVGAASGGIWKSTTAGSSWQNITSNLPTLGVSSIVVHPTNPDIIYAGTGDRDAGDAPGFGVYRSTDGGLTWSAWNSGMGQRTVYEILMHPGNPSIMIASSNGRIHRTTNGGSSWTQSYSGSENFKDLAFKPGDPDIVYAASNDFFRSTNNGQSFALVTSGLPTNASRFAIAVSPDEPDWVYVFAGNSSGLVGLYRSTNSGVDFSTQSTSPNICGYGTTGGSGSQAWYDLVLMADPNNASTIYASAINIWKSTNSGVSWTLIAHWTGGGGAAAIHADQHALEWHPSTNAIYAGCDGGLYRSTNNGTNWADISDGLAIAQVYKIGQSKLTKNLVINGYQDNGTGFLKPAGWYTEIGGDGMECAIDPTNDNFMYGELYYGDIRRSSNGGNTFSGITSGISESGAWVTPFKLDPNNAARMFVGMKNVWRTNNVKTGTPSWTQISSFSGTSNITDIAIAPSNSDVVYVSRAGAFYHSTNATSGSPTWTSLTLPASGTPRDIEISPTDPNTLWIALGNNVYKSTNAGASWTSYSSGLPSRAVYTLVYDPNGPADALYAGLSVGVYYRDASMSSWAPFSDGLPIVEVTELEVYHDPNCMIESRIRAGTYGRGLWESILCDPGNVAPSVCTEVNPATVCPGDVVSLKDNSHYNPTGWNWTFSGGGVVFVNGTSATSQGPQVVFTSSGNVTITLTATNANGWDTSSQTITVLPGPSVDLGPDQGICPGENIVLDAGGGFTTYMWSTGATTSSISVSSGSTYSVTVTSGGGCPGIDVVVIEQHEPAAVSLGPDESFCAGNSVTLNTNGSFATYAWSTGATTSSITVSSGGNYAVTITDTNNCVASDAITLTVNPLPTVNLGPDVGFCIGDNVVLDAGNGFSNYAWSNGATSNTIQVSADGTYSVTITDGNGCENNDEVVVTEHALPTVSLGPDQDFCEGSDVILSPGGFTAYAWSTGATTSSISVNTSGAYSVTVTDPNGCENDDDIDLTELPLPVVDLGGDVGFCAGDSVMLSAGSWFTDYEWSHGPFTESVAITNGGNYSVTVTDSNGCENSDNMTATEHALPVVDLGNDTTICHDAVLILNAGSGMTSYSWTSSETTQTVSVNATAIGLGQHTYTVTVIDANGCEGSAQIVVTVDVCGAIAMMSERVMSVYPNPFTDQLVVELPLGEWLLKLYDVTGALVLERGEQATQAYLDLGWLAAGVYVIEAGNVARVLREKVVKE